MFLSLGWSQCQLCIKTWDVTVAAILCRKRPCRSGNAFFSGQGRRDSPEESPDSPNLGAEIWEGDESRRFGKGMRAEDFNS